MFNDFDTLKALVDERQRSLRRTAEPRAESRPARRRGRWHRRRR